MPFPDEVSRVTLVEYQPEWPMEFDRLSKQLYEAMGEFAVSVDHVGSTSVPGMSAKDCIDVQIRMKSIDERRSVYLLDAIGFRCRPEPWNRSEVCAGQRYKKLVFAPPRGARACNVHLREKGTPNARYALLFRDYLRADESACQAWSAFKHRLAQRIPDLNDYGHIKTSATDVLMIAAEHWATETNWSDA